jgi:hypothetical protein
VGSDGQRMAPPAPTLREGLSAVASSPAARARAEGVNPRSRASMSSVCQKTCDCAIMTGRMKWVQACTDA